MSDNTIAVPRGIRVGAYLTGTAVGLLGDPGVTYLGAEHQIDKPTTVFLGVVFGAVTVLTNILALSHLPLPAGTTRPLVAGGVIPAPMRITGNATQWAADMGKLRGAAESPTDPADDVQVVTEDPTPTTTTEADHG